MENVVDLRVYVVEEDEFQEAERIVVEWVVMGGGSWRLFDGRAKGEGFELGAGGSGVLISCITMAVSYLT